jgi:hypothetical protein
MQAVYRYYRWKISDERKGEYHALSFMSLLVLLCTPSLAP